MSTETPAADLQDEDVQARLMRMLDSVRLEKPEESSQDENFVEPAGCPHCGSLESWGTASWCPDCGYYPKLGRAVTPVEVAEAAQLTLKDLLWAFILGGGVLLLLVGSLAVRFTVPEADSRSQWAVCQILLGFTLLCIAQVQAYLVAAQTEGTVTLGSLFFEPAKLWGPVLKALPGSQRTLHLGVWSVMSIALAFAVVGVDFNSVFGVAGKKKKPVNPMKTMMKMVGAAAASKTAFSANGEEEAEEPSIGGNVGGGGVGNPNMSMEDAVNTFADGAGAHDLTASARQGQGNSRNGKNGKPIDRAGGPAGVMLDENGEPVTTENGVAVKGGEPGTVGDGMGEVPAVEAVADAKLEEQNPKVAGGENAAAQETKTDPATPEVKDGASDEGKPLVKPRLASLQRPLEQPDPEPPLTSSGEVRKDRSEFIVFGFLTNAAGQLRSVLLADIRNDRLHFAGKMPVEELSAERLEQLQGMLETYRARSPILETPYRARWVQPVVKIRVGHLGWTASGEIREAYLIGFEDLSNLVGR